MILQFVIKKLTTQLTLDQLISNCLRANLSSKIVIKQILKRSKFFAIYKYTFFLIFHFRTMCDTKRTLFS